MPSLCKCPHLVPRICECCFIWQKGIRKSSHIPSPAPKGQQRQDQDIILLQMLAGGQVGRKVSLCPQAGRFTFSALPYCSVSPLKGLLSPSSPVIVTLLSFPFYFPLQKRQTRTRRRRKWEMLQSQFSAWHAWAHPSTPWDRLARRPRFGLNT